MKTGTVKLIDEDVFEIAEKAHRKLKRGLRITGTIIAFVGIFGIIGSIGAMENGGDMHELIWQLWRFFILGACGGLIWIGGQL